MITAIAFVAVSLMLTSEADVIVERAHDNLKNAVQVSGKVDIIYKDEKASEFNFKIDKSSSTPPELYSDGRVEWSYSVDVDQYIRRQETVSKVSAPPHMFGLNQTDYQPGNMKMTVWRGQRVAAETLSSKETNEKVTLYYDPISCLPVGWQSEDKKSISAVYSNVQLSAKPKESGPTEVPQMVITN